QAGEDLSLRPRLNRHDRIRVVERIQADGTRHAHARAVAVDEEVAQDGQQPGANGTVGAERLATAQGPQCRLLDEILGLVGIVCQRQGTPIERLPMREHHLLEIPLTHSLSTLPAPMSARAWHRIKASPPTAASVSPVIRYWSDTPSTAAMT